MAALPKLQLLSLAWQCDPGSRALCPLHSCSSQAAKLTSSADLQGVRCPLQILNARIVRPLPAHMQSWPWLAVVCPDSVWTDALACEQNPMQKDWEHYKLNKNGKPIVTKMHVKIGDTVKVIRGIDKGKVGTVKEVSADYGTLAGMMAGTACWPARGLTVPD